VYVKAKSTTDLTKEDWGVATTAALDLQGFRAAWVAAHASQPQVDALYDLDHDGSITWADASAFFGVLVQAQQGP
jgi:hypothetical protein